MRSADDIRLTGVSIHAPLRREERRKLGGEPGSAALFQSTPPSGERSDLDGSNRAKWQERFNPRPPPERGATRRVQKHRDRDGVSIHAPLRREERRYLHIAYDLGMSFQSTPPSGERSDFEVSNVVSLWFVVSIHAPLRREERQYPFLGSLNRAWFQSTPPSGERSDTPRIMREQREVQFQSTPPSGERSDNRNKRRVRRTCEFQSTPPSGERSDGSAGEETRASASFNPRPPPERGATFAQMGQ